MSTTHVPGTLYPTDGQAPHLPTQCRHRSSRQRNHRSQTVLCYARGEWEPVNPATGEPARIQTAEGPMPYRFCAKHKAQVERSHRGATWRQVSEQEGAR